MNAFRLACTFAVALAATSAAPAAPGRYTIVDLGRPASNNVSHVYAISTDGDLAVGRGVVGSNKALAWDPVAGTMAELPGYSTNNMAVGVTTGGVIVGNASTSAGTVSGLNAYSTNNVPVMWKNGAVTAIAASGRVYGINNHGLAVGSVGTAGSIGESAVIYDTTLSAPTMSFIDATTADGLMMNTALGINDAGLVIGTALVGTGTVALAYDTQTQQMTRVASLDGLLQGTQVRDVNAAGAAVGFSGTVSVPAPYSWSAAAGLQPLPLAPGLLNGQATGINDAGAIVGSGKNSLGFVQPFLVAGGQGVLLADLVDGLSGWKFGNSLSTSITGIANDGTIVGYTEFIADGNRVHAFALVPLPVPEPTTTALLLAGLAAIGGIAQRRRPQAA